MTAEVHRGTQLETNGAAFEQAVRQHLRGATDAAEAGYRVGYEDPAYFSRDNKRHFGEPPMRDVERLREAPRESAR